MEHCLEENVCDASLTTYSESDSDSSGSNLEIKIEHIIIPECVTSSNSINENNVIERLKDEIEGQIEEKAEKDFLAVTSVKTIIKQILSPEHVKTLITKYPDLSESKHLVHKPKLTRAKAKELLSTITIQPVPPSWIPQPPPSETRILIGEDLKEDDSGDEYVPTDEIEDDKSAASESDTSSLPPPTPPTPISMEDIGTQTTYTDDGVFKIPPSKVKDGLESEQVANIALRTRSKINLSSTPLEELEKSFVPPDITTDMYDLECDDDVWKDFLKGFTEPLDVIDRPNDDEEHDPEYNILADDQINEDDDEDFDAKGVKVTKKEIKKLWDELYDYLQDISQFYSADGEGAEYQQSEAELSFNTIMESRPQIVPQIEEKGEIVTEEPKMNEIIIQQQQINILENQMRQHIQMLAQTFLLTYSHPEFHDKSFQCREQLLDLKSHAGERTNSMFIQINLLPAIQLVDEWIRLFTTDNKEVIDCRDHVITELAKSLQLKMAGNSTYILTFPRLVLETIAKSNVFMYPSLLPKTPFKLGQFFRKKEFTDAEDRLLVFGLDKFTKMLEEDRSSDKIKLNEKVALVQEFIMPHKKPQYIMRHILQRKHAKCAPNPIQQYFRFKTISPVIHYLHPLNQILAPCQRLPEELPYQWRTFLYPEESKFLRKLAIKTDRNILQLPQQVVLINPAFVPSLNLTGLNSFLYNCNSAEIRAKKRSSPIVKKTKRAKKLNGYYTVIDRFVSIIKRPVNIQKLLQLLAEIDEQNSARKINLSGHRELNYKMSNMPSLTPLKNNVDSEDGEEISKHPTDVKKLLSVNIPSQDPKKERCTKNLEFSKISSKSFQRAGSSSEVEFYKNSSDVQICRTSQCDEKCSKLKESIEEHPVMASTSTITKSNTRKEPSGAEKKKNKLKKEFFANLTIATPEDKEKEVLKNERFALAYYDKLRETLVLQDYRKLMQILSVERVEDVVDLYKQVQAVLEPKYPELLEEFLYFLEEKEAAVVGQLIPWFEVQTRIKFCHKLEIYFKDQPGQLKKIYNTLMEFSRMKDLTMDKIKSALLPLLKGNAILTDLFLQNFKDETPPPSLITEPFESVSLDRQLATQISQAIFEKFVVPNMEDKYGGPNCICHCHKIEDNDYKTRYKHCNSCGLRFIQGKIFIQSGRGLQPATISFSTCPEKSFINIEGISSASNHLKKMSQLAASHSKQTSSKEVIDEDTEDEDPCKRKKSLAQKSTTKRNKSVTGKVTFDSTKTSSSKKSPARITGTSSIMPRRRTTKRRKSNASGIAKKRAYRTKAQNTMDTVDERLTDDCMDSSGESLEKPLTPDQQTAESENEFLCEASSQDNYESNSSSSSIDSFKGSQSDSNNDEPPWKREEDTIILETFQKEDDKAYALQIISHKLPHRSRRDINSRFSKLMALLLETLKQN